MRMPTMRGEKDRCLKKGRVLKAVAAPARRAMKSMPGREGSWEENFIFVLPERVEMWVDCRAVCRNVVGERK